MKYKIKLSYSTGDSFSFENTSDILEMTWSSLELAKENLRRIKEHYICYKVDKDYQGLKGFYFAGLPTEYKTMYSLRKSREWYVENDPHQAIKLVADSGNPWQIYCFWVGYFENLQRGEIINFDSDTSFEF